MRGLSYLLLSLFVFSCSREPPLGSDRAVSKAANGSAALHPAGKITDADCPLCGFLGDDNYTIPDGQGDPAAAEEEDDETTEDENNTADDTPGDERAVLVALYEATGGGNWHSSGNWLSEAPLKDWYGVGANSEGQVAKLQLQANGLSGALPSELGNLAKLEELRLSNNQLNGAIPPELGRLANLEQLYLGRNRLSGAIPPELGQLKSLTYLELHENRLSGAIPPELGQLRRLRHLWIGNNQLSGSVPSELGQLTSLIVANIAGNLLTGCLPAAWCGVNPGGGAEPYRLPFCEATLRSTGAFNIELVYLNGIRPLTPCHKAIFQRAVSRWEQVITGDLPDITFQPVSLSGWNEHLNAWVHVADTVDDLRIFVRTRDLSDNTWGSAEIYAIRNLGKLPIVSTMVIDAESLDESAEAVYALALHEIGHCLGFGASWGALDLLQESSRNNRHADTHFSGAMARQWFDDLGGSSYHGAKVPVENGGDDGHWRASVFGDELLTPEWVWPYPMPLSAITIASMADIGYEVNLDTADEYWVPSTSSAKPVADEAWPGCRVFRQPIYVVAEDGRIVDILDPYFVGDLD